jgi:anthranilate phosphoribosyltransferase
MSAHSVSLPFPLPEALAPVTVEDYLRKVHRGHALNRSEARSVVSLLLSPETTDAQAGAMLAALSLRGETVEEVVGFVEGMRTRMVHLNPYISGAVDTAGTGASQARGFNVSTAAAIIAAGAGVTVAKHGGRAGTSLSGSADVLQALGVKIDCAPERAVECLRTAGMAFFFAPLYHPAMARIAPVRRQLGIRTTFNLAGPLSNPLGARRQVIGVADARLLEVMAGALVELGTEHALVIHGAEGLDEISIAGPTEAIEVRGRDFTRFQLQPEDFGAHTTPLRMQRLGPAENAAILGQVLNGKAEPALQELVICNAAAAVYVSGKAPALAEAATICRESVRTGAAVRVLHAMVKTTAEGAQA